MQRNLLIIAAFVMLFMSCKKDDMSYSSEFDRSYRSWQAFKASTNNSYSYISTSASIFGFSSETKITIQNGVAIRREYVAKGYAPGTNNLQVIKSWTEDSATINTHQEGAAAITLDEIYEKARTEYLTADKKTNKVYFEANNDGMISAAGYILNNCMDDCSIGVNIKSITRL